MSRYLAAKWLLRAERLAGLPKLVGGTFSPLPAFVGHRAEGSQHEDRCRGGRVEVQESLAIYQGVDDTDILDAVVNQRAKR